MDIALRQFVGAPRRVRPPRIALQIGVVAIALMLLLLMAVMLSGRLARSTDMLPTVAEEADNLVATVNSVVPSLQDTIIDERVFMLTQQESAAKLYVESIARTNEALRGLDAVASTIPSLREPADSVISLVKEKLAQLDRIMARVRSGDMAAAVQLTRDGWQSLQPVLRAQIDDIRAKVISARDERMTALRARVHEAAAGIVSLAMAGLLLLGLATTALITGWENLVRKTAAASIDAKRLSTTIDRLRDGVAVFDSADRLQLWNSNFFDTSGLSGDLATPGTSFARFAAAAAGWTGSPLGAPKPQGAPVSARVTNGDRVLEVWRSAMPDGGQMVTVTDTTQRVAADASALKVSKMEALEQLTGEVAHDFNNLLQVVSSNLELLRPLLPADEQAGRRLAAALGSVERAAQLTLHLLAIARRQPLAPDTVDPARLLHGMEELLRRNVGPAIQIEVAVHAAVWAVRADPHLLEDAILHLAMNARDAMPQGGRLMLSASNIVLDETPHGSGSIGSGGSGHGDVAPGEYVLVSVSDTGIGMEAETLARATEPFFTTKVDRRGSGLGLPMVLGFARQSGGNFELESTPGRGTTARLYIPRRRSMPDPLRTAPSGEEVVTHGHGEVVLAVEDDDAVRIAAVQAIGSLGYRVLEASNAAEALTLLQQGARPDILFTDIVMPGEPSARELAEEARRLHPGIAVLFTSGYVDQSRTAAFAADGSFTLLSKPWRIGDLGRELRGALRAARTASSGARSKRAVVVEDDNAVRMVTADLLIELGYEVAEYVNGQDALQALRDGCADLLIVDIGLPDMSGLDVARQALELVPEVAVVVASGAGNDPEERFTFLEKPYDAVRLRRAVALARTTAA